MEVKGDIRVLGLYGENDHLFVQHRAEVNGQIVLMEWVPISDAEIAKRDNEQSLQSWKRAVLHNETLLGLDVWRTTTKAKMFAEEGKVYVGERTVCKRQLMEHIQTLPTDVRSLIEEKFDIPNGKFVLAQTIQFSKAMLNHFKKYMSNTEFFEEPMYYCETTSNEK